MSGPLSTPMAQCTPFFPSRHLASHFASFLTSLHALTLTQCFLGRLVGRCAQVQKVSPTAVFELCLVANRMLGSEVLGKATVEIATLVSERRTDRWYSLKSKKNVDAGSVRLVTVIDGGDDDKFSAARPSAGSGSEGTSGGYFGATVRAR